MNNIVIILALNHYTGVTTWARDLIKGLSKHYIVNVLYENQSPYLISNTEYTKDIQPYINNVNDRTIKYDVAILHNTYNESTAKKIANKTIFVSHSSIVNSCKPKMKHDFHIAASACSHNILKSDMHIQNAIDTNFFKKDNSPSFPDGKIRCLYHNRVSPQKIVVDACNELGFTLDFWPTIKRDVRDKINKADFVIAYGRSAYEAMSMSKPVLVFGHNSLETDTLKKTGVNTNPGGLCDGWITENNFDDLLYRNCSGYHKQHYVETKDELIEYLHKYDYRMGHTNRDLILKKMSIETMVNDFINVIERVL